MWQTTFYTQHELTCICRTLDAASSSSLESVFGSNQKHEATIDTFPSEGKENAISTPLIHRTQLQDITYVRTHKIPSKFISSILILLFPNSWLNAASSFTYSEVFQFDKLITAPPAIGRYTRYTTKIVEEQTVILIFNVSGDYKNIELVWNMSSVVVEFFKVWLRVPEFQGLKLHKKNLHEQKKG